MNPRVLIRGSLKSFEFCAPLVVAVLALIGAFIALLAEAPELARIGLWIGGVCAVITVVAGGSLVKRRRWLEVTDHGLVIVDRDGRREYSDDQLRDIKVAWQHHYPDGTLKSSTCSCSLWLEDDTGVPERIDASIQTKTGQPDVLGDLAIRLCEALRERVKADLAAGRSFTGGGWTLTPEGLQMDKGSPPPAVRFDELAAASFVDGRLCVWRQGDEHPAIRIPPNSKNVGVLADVLAERVPEESGTASDAAGLGEGWGRILFERKGPVWLLWILPVAALGAGLWLVSQEEIVVGGITLAAGGLVALIAWRMRKATFRCQEHGVCKVGLFGETRLRYDEIEIFSYNAIRQFVNGIYSGTNLKLSFAGGPAAGGKDISYSTTVSGSDDDLDNLRDHVSNVIANGMAAQLAEGRSVQWTRNLRFLPEGIEWTQRGLLGVRKSPLLISYEQVVNFDVEEGRFRLYTAEGGKPIATENIAEPNFFPGFHLFLRLYTPDEEPGEDAAGADGGDAEELTDGET